MFVKKHERGVASTIGYRDASRGADEPDDSMPGAFLCRKFRVIRELGRGSMGRVYLVRHRALGCLRAVKTIAPGLAHDPAVRRRFRHEARALQALAGHPNAVTVHDARIAASGSYIEMEYVEGQDLRAIIQRGRPLPTPSAVAIGTQICDVLQRAHEAGIVHRDLKPANVMLHHNSERLKVLDFGLSGLLSLADRRVHDLVTGSPAYASPEQLTGMPVDPRTDLYSLGVVLYELLTGFLPFEGSLTGLVVTATSCAPLPPSTRNPTAPIPPALERLVLDCLAKPPADRPASASEVAARLLAA
ncbi:MAG: serine/threonine-protein kinase [Isosphaeraceae bacterium]|nr:serine/threonine-protein kinase [Isosphaeraceae bacterium]